MVRFGLSCLAAAAAAAGVAGKTDGEVGPVVSMDAGSFHTVVLIQESTGDVVKDWGANGKGQLGLNDTKDRGDNDGNVGDLLPEVVLDTELNATAVAAGLRHTVAILSNGSVRSWGYNGKGQLGIGNLENVGDEPNEMGDNMAVTDLGDGVTPIAISAGGWHTCAIIDNYKLKCWGYNQWGELGLGDKNDRGDEPNEMGDYLDEVDLGDDVTVESIALGDWHTCALLSDGNVKCFGKNFAGQLGMGDTVNRGDDDYETGNNLHTVNLGNKKATAIAAGEEHTCAILEDGELRCWGLGSSGQLGQGNQMNIGDSSGDMDTLAGIDLGTGRTAVEVAAGGNHTCALLDNDDIKCWGENDYGELGQGDVSPRGLSPNQMGDFLPAIEMGEGWTVHSLSAGYYHNCAIVDQVDELSSVVCWGANFKGQIGLGISETEHIGDQEGEMGDALGLANLGGDSEEEPGDEWYETLWFYIVCGVVAVFLVCFLCVLCRRAHGDNSGRGTWKAGGSATYKTGARPSAPPAPDAPAAEDGDQPADVEKPANVEGADDASKPAEGATAPVATPPTPVGDSQA